MTTDLTRGFLHLPPVFHGKFLAYGLAVGRLEVKLIASINFSALTLRPN
jgi:hypothetical protein